MQTHQLDLFGDFASGPPPMVQEAPFAAEAPIPLAIVCKIPSTKKDTSYEGFTNSATYNAALYLNNEFKVYKHFEDLYISGQLTGTAIQNHFTSMKMKLEEWADGQVNWEEILKGYEETFCELKIQSIPQSALYVLSQSIVRDNTVILPCQLERGLYAQVKKLLDSMGGKWNRSKGGHLFADDPSDQLEMVVLTGSVKKIDKFGYFPTPRPLAEAVVALAGIEEGMTVFEPSAGSGNLLDIITSYTNKANIHCCELQPKNVAILVEKGYRVEEGDFLSLTPSASVDSVVMNPPFERQMDIDHVLHALKFLKPGGILVSIMSASVTFRDNNKSRAFREKIEELGYYTENPEGSFKVSGTGVNTITVVLRKPRHSSSFELESAELEAA